MDTQKVDLFLASNAKFFEPYMLPAIKQQLLETTDDKFLVIQSVPFKDPTIVLLMGIFGGGFGLDRFYLGDVGQGIGK